MEAGFVCASFAVALLGGPLSAQERYHPFEQDVDYRIEATLDESSHVLTGRARLRYVNHAPEALERLYFHQYLNAFRPHSAWAEYDLRFDTRTFQDLGPDDHAFERIRSFAVNGHVVEPVYPFAPDSTVFYVETPYPIVPGDRLEAEIDWTARLATEPRRQGRLGRHYDWAHWYPRIAVYGADGWEYRPHIRPGELNGAFAVYDVTLELAADQVLGATGVAAEGDPGWERVAVPGSEPVHYRRDYYQPRPGDDEPLGILAAATPAGRKRVRWHAERVHNFAWATSPEFVYRGGRWDTTPIHFLWEPGDWQPDEMMELQQRALGWIAELFGAYPWPQLTVTDRVEGGATEFPMLYMTSGGAVVHETMHMVAHGILASNEWREGWLDEGMASFLTNWLEESRGTDPIKVWGPALDAVAELERRGETEPVGLPAAEFSSYQMYSRMTYTKGSIVLRMLRDLLGEPTFRQAMRAYYDRFRFRQVTGADFQRVMEDVSGRDLDGFFHQWIETTEGKVRAP